MTCLVADLAPDQAVLSRAARGPHKVRAAGRRPRWRRYACRRGGGMNIQEMLERLPTIALADVKVSDTILSQYKGLILHG